MSKKILYVMHIDWRWIKQRPHFIAEGLLEYYQVKVVYFYSKRFLPCFKTNKNKGTLSKIPIIRLPFYQNKWIYKINKAYLRFYFKILIKKYDPDYLWITFPLLYTYIPPKVECKVIYDCMDDARSFDFSENFKFYISESEKRLVKDASIIFTSSNSIYEILKNNYKCEDKLYVIRNAFNGKIIDEINVEKNKKYKIGYFGTISSWFDYDALRLSLEKFPSIEYYLIGPIESHVPKYEHSRLNYVGPVDHKELYNHVKNYDCLIMPFKLNNLVKSVDPTKLYEYINFNKPIISIYYEELEYFSPFLYFYHNHDELLDIINNLIQSGFNKKYSDSERLEFLNRNSWKERLLKIRESIDSKIR